MLVIDVLDIHPLELEIALKFERMVFPPEGEGLLVIARLEPGDSFEHAALDCTEE